MAINVTAALSAWNSAGIDPVADYHTLSSAQVEVVLEQAKLSKYSKPKDANGSRARYFFYAVQRKYEADRKYFGMGSARK
jgi:hypothetical protein